MTGFTNVFTSFVNDHNKRKNNALLTVLNNIKETLEATSIVSHLALSDVRKYYCQLLGDLNSEFVNVNSTCFNTGQSKDCSKHLRHNAYRHFRQFKCFPFFLDTQFFKNVQLQLYKNCI